MAIDRDQVDLLLVIGTSLQVQPVSLIAYSISESTPQILINREELPHYNADIKLIGLCVSIQAAYSLFLADVADRTILAAILGDCDTIVKALALAIGGEVQTRILQGRRRWTEELRLRLVIQICARDPKAWMSSKAARRSSLQRPIKSSFRR